MKNPSSAASRTITPLVAGRCPALPPMPSPFRAPVTAATSPPAPTAATRPAPKTPSTLIESLRPLVRNAPDRSSLPRRNRPRQATGNRRTGRHHPRRVVSRKCQYRAIKSNSRSNIIFWTERTGLRAPRGGEDQVGIPDPTSNAEAMDMVMTGLRYMTATDPTALVGQAQAECLQTLAHADAMSTAVRARYLAAFAARQGYSHHADHSPPPARIHRTPLTKGAARAHPPRPPPPPPPPPALPP